MVSTEIKVDRERVGTYVSYVTLMDWSWSQSWLSQLLTQLSFKNKRERGRLLTLIFSPFFSFFFSWFFTLLTRFLFPTFSLNQVRQPFSLSLWLQVEGTGIEGVDPNWRKRNSLFSIDKEWEGRRSFWFSVHCQPFWCVIKISLSKKKWYYKKWRCHVNSSSAPHGHLWVSMRWDWTYILTLHSILLWAIIVNSIESIRYIVYCVVGDFINGHPAMAPLTNVTQRRNRRKRLSLFSH